MWMNLSIALEYIRNRKRQSVFSVLGVVMGVAFFIAIASMMQGMHSYFIEKLVDVAPHVKIMDEFRESETQPIYRKYSDSIIELRGVKPKEEIRGIRSADKIIIDLEKRKDLSVAPALLGEAFLRYGGKDIGASIIGINPEKERFASNLERDMVKGNLNSLLTNSSGIILGKSLAKKLSIKMGNKLSVISPAGIIKKMKVVGIFDTGVTEMDSVTSFILLKKAQILQEKQNVINRINIRLKNINQATEIALEMEGRYKYKSESWQETFANIFEMFIIENAIMYSTVAAILMVAGFGIYNIISTSVNEKSKDIAILKSMGFCEKDIRLIFLFQGIVIGVVGTIIGWIIGAVIIELLTLVKLDTSGEVDMPFQIEGFPMYRSISLYIWGGFLAIMSSAISAYIPARKAASLKPVDIIRGAA